MILGTEIPALFLILTAVERFVITEKLRRRIKILHQFQNLCCLFSDVFRRTCLRPTWFRLDDIWIALAYSATAYVIVITDDYAKVFFFPGWSQ